MRIRALEVRRHAIPLTTPYAIASGTTSAVELVTVELTGDAGVVGCGAGTPEESVTGETFAASTAALAEERTAPLVGQRVDTLGALLGEIERGWAATPAAAAALDLAVHDLYARAVALPLVDLLGRMQLALPTSVTIGILPAEETVAAARRFVEQGFRALKLKIGLDLEGDLARIAAVRRAVGPAIAIRIDGNCGFRVEQVERLVRESLAQDVELVEQPCPPESDDELAALPFELRRHLVADESIHTPADALRLATADGGRPLVGGFVVKLMKCGGIGPARRIAAIAETAGIDLMWGCMDESALGIAGALHAAFATRATRWLDLDGSLDLAHDPARGGFALADGRMTTLPTPGLGAEIET